MKEINYKPLIDDMTWSYSRISSFNDCKHKFFLKYIKEYPDEELFFASYGKLVHKILEEYYSGKLSKQDMLIEFFSRYKDDIKGARPSSKIADTYIQNGVDYLKSFNPMPFNMIDVELMTEFKIENYNFVGIIDYVGEKDGNIYIVDNKSRNLKPRSSRSKPTKNDEELDSMYRQLYLYSIPIKDRFGKYPKELIFNCFRNGNIISEEFNEDKLEEAKNWAIESIHQIEKEIEFEPNYEFFSCRNICGLHNHCDDYLWEVE